jgi:hypothetical protein
VFVGGQFEMAKRGQFVRYLHIEANPQYKTVNLYDAQMKRVQKEMLGPYQAVEKSQGKEVKQEQKQDVKQDVKKTVKPKLGDEMDGSKKKSSRKKGMSV